MTYADEAFECLEEFFRRLFGLAETEAVRALADSDISFSQARMIFCVARGREPLTISEIAHGIGLSTAAAGRNVDQLVKLGFVERHENPDDRRIKLVSLTEAGVAYARGHIDEKRTAVRALLDRLPEADCRRLTEALRPILSGDYLSSTMKGETHADRQSA
ncbi:MAG: MarR family transcriptional regulator [Aeromicrobium sp.]|uniref:MarR family winged helix-turn-helix transcriptional regulator n=1 Tax=Aeromicrobium sp. TaxID=1871063 RepID=UPI0039E45DC9